jgi:elongation factor Ts
MVKELREKSGAGMMDCKKALTETLGDLEKAIDYLRENGMMKAAKKADRIAAEGLCQGLVSPDGKKAVVVEVNSETDFVAKNDLFKGFVNKVAEQAMGSAAENLEDFLAEAWKFEDGKSVNDALVAAIAVISENLKIRRFAKMEEENGFITVYTHAGGKIVVLLDVETDVVNDAIVDMAKNVAMQVAAMRPKYNSRAEVDQDYIEKEKEVLLAAAKNEKPNANEKIWNGMVMGRINKELADICLQDQVYVKAEDGKQTVGKYIAEVGKANGANLNVKGFIRFETGEGIEKKVENFAEEVAAQRKA